MVNCFWNFVDLCVCTTLCLPAIVACLKYDCSLLCYICISNYRCFTSVTYVFSIFAAISLLLHLFHLCCSCVLSVAAVSPLLQLFSLCCSCLHKGLFAYQELLPTLPERSSPVPGIRRELHGHLQSYQQQQQPHYNYRGLHAQ